MNLDRKQFIPAYEGNDMAGYAMKIGLYLSEPETIKSITNIRDFAIVVTDRNIYRLRPQYGIGFCVERLWVI